MSKSRWTLCALIALTGSVFAADFGDIPANLSMPAGQAVRRNAGNTAFEAFTPGSGAGTVTSLTATAPIIVTPSPITSTGIISIDPNAYQPLDGDLTTLSALTGTNTIYYRSAADTWTAVTMGGNMTFSGGVLNSTGGGGAHPLGGSITGRGDANYTILSTDKIVATNAAFTAARTWTLPAASTVTAGNGITISDHQGTVNTTNTLTVQRGASDLIFPSNTASYIMSNAYQSTTFISDGVSKWYAEYFLPGLNATGGNGGFAQTSWQAGVWASSLYNLPTSIGSTGKILQSNGSNVVFSAPAWPANNTAAGKIVRGNGTNFVESTATYPDTAGTLNNVLTSDGTNWISSAPTGGGAGTGLSYITKVAEGTLSNEFALGSLATGLLKNTTSTGVPTIAVAGTDYEAALGNPGTNGFVLSSTTTGTRSWVAQTGGAPSGATYITQTADGTLSAEQALSSLGTGLLKNTTGTGVLSIATAGTDYISGFANPTGSVGTAAVNGSATTAMRSDAAPQINLGMSPIWTAAHTWTIDDALTNSIAVPLTLKHSVTGTATTGIGVATEYYIESAGGSVVQAARQTTAYSNAGSGLEAAYHNWQLISGGSLGDKMRLHASSGLSVGTGFATDPGSGWINATSGFKVNNSQIAFSNLANLSAASRLTGSGSAGTSPVEISLGSGLSMSSQTLNASFTGLGGNWTLAQGPSITAGKLLGRDSASAGIPQEISLGTNLSMSGTTLNATGGGGAPTTATYITQTADATLSAEQALSSLATGLLKNTTATGVLSIAASGTDYEVPLTFSTGLTRSTNTVTVNTSQNISTLSNLTTNGFVKTSGGTGALSVDTNTYLTSATGVTTFASGNLSPLFTVTPSSATSGAITQAFTLSTAAANTVFGNNTGSTAAPAFQSLVNAQIPATLSSKTFDDTNTYTAKDGSFTLENTTTPTKKAIFDLSNIASATTRTVNIPNANSTTIQSDTGATNNFLTAVSAQGVISKAQPAITNLQNLSAVSKLVGSNASSAAVTEITLGTNLSMTGSTLNAAGGAGGTPGGSNTQVQYNNSSAFGGITNATSDGTTLTLTSPKIVTGTNDTNGNTMLAYSPTASAVNYFTIANGATGTPANVTLSTTGSTADVDMTLAVKGAGRMYVKGQSSADTSLEILNLVADNSSGAGGVGLGPSLIFKAESSTTPNTEQSGIDSYWEDATHSTRGSALALSNVLSGIYHRRLVVHKSGGTSIGDDADGMTDPGMGYLDVQTGLKINGTNIFPVTAANGGVPSGGTTGQVLAKNSNTNYDVGWTTGGGGGAPTTATYIVQTADGSLTNEQVLGSLATGLMKSTTTTGVVSTITDNSANWDTAFTDRLKWDGGATGLTASTGRTSLGATTVGGNLFTLTNPSAITFLRINADNSVTAQTAANFKTDLSLNNVTNDAQIKASDFPASSVDSEVALFSSTTGKVLKRASATGIAKLASGVLSAVTAPSGAIVGDTDTQTLTNKRVNPRVVSAASGATWSPNGDTSDVFTITTAQAVNVTTINSPSGTPVDGQKLMFRIKCDGTARTLAGWNAIYRASSASGAPALPSTLTASKTLYMGFQYNSTDSTWDLLALQDGF